MPPWPPLRKKAAVLEETLWKSVCCAFLLWWCGWCQSITASLSVLELDSVCPRRVSVWAAVCLCVCLCA